MSLARSILTCEHRWHGVGEEYEHQKEEEARQICHHFRGVIADIVENYSQEESDNYVSNHAELRVLLQ